MAFISRESFLGCSTWTTIWGRSPKRTDVDKEIDNRPRHHLFPSFDFFIQTTSPKQLASDPRYLFTHGRCSPKHRHLQDELRREPTDTPNQCQLLPKATEGNQKYRNRPHMAILCQIETCLDARLSPAPRTSSSISTMERNDAALRTLHAYSIAC
ncbi:unnamed protein product [Fusarium graminearum]|uniref:Uncharacterized protein n=1 Tax=Gibberella zeae TaxID=5518 RepID=A0A4E9D5N0_GIBZA|nr:unnamed protein product [Fusarium graminearum]CAF3492271.1 unnamed protein product [Fusarium graminearum]CAG1970695.1 unnamed protein product [Fusarium graminearum]CAG1976902.1 unnamed protein product [Fusarium graminearum]